MKKLFILSLSALFVLSACGVPSEVYDEFAQCLTEKGVVEYGAFWCPNCAKQKKLFGDAYQYIKYVECDPRGEESQTQLCLDKQIEKYPTWEFADGVRMIGKQDLYVLGAKTGCELPTDS